MLNIPSQYFQNGLSVQPFVGRPVASPVVHTEHAPHLLQLLATLASQTDTQQGWLLVIAPPQPLTKSMLSQLNIDSKRILVIQQRQITHFDNLMRDALTCSTCCAVVSFLPAEHPQLEDYQYLSAKYGTALVNLNADGQHTVTTTH